jgi:hypothetical protein
MTVSTPRRARRRITALGWARLLYVVQDYRLGDQYESLPARERARWDHLYHALKERVTPEAWETLIDRLP